MLVLTSGGLLLTGTRPGSCLGAFRIIGRMMDLIRVELNCACGLGHLDHRLCPYHFNLQDYVGLAVRVMRVCQRQLGRVDALTSVSDKVDQAGALSLRAFVRGFRDLDEMGVCLICQDGYKLGGYGVLPCGHIMHLDCWVSYEASERRRAPHRLPECSICKARFEGFVCICV